MNLKTKLSVLLLSAFWLLQRSIELVLQHAQQNLKNKNKRKKAMSDVADDADRQIEQELEAARAKRYPTLVACGRCYDCNEAVPVGHLFCDAECRDWWQRQQDADRRNGLTR